MKKNIIKLNDVKNANILAILELLIRNDGLSRIEIAEKLACDNTTVTRAVRELVSRGIIVPRGRTELAHGRPRVGLTVNPEGPVLLGIALEPECITGVLADLRGNVRCRECTRFGETPPRKVFLDAAETLLRSLVKTAGSRLTGVGAAVFGSYSGPDCRLESAAAFPALNGLALQPFLDNASGRRVLISGTLVAETQFLMKRNPLLASGSALLIFADEGIGLVAAENGRQLFSRGNRAGELGHNICVPDGLPCACGRRGCLETVASIPAVLDRCREKLGRQKLRFEDLPALLNSGSLPVVEAVESAAHSLGIAAANQLNNFPADRLVIAGRILTLGERYSSMLQETMKTTAFPSNRNALPAILLAEREPFCRACGAALLAEAAALHALVE